MRARTNLRGRQPRTTAASVEIVDVRTNPANPQPGEDATVVVEMVNNGGGDRVWIEITSPAFDQKILHYCTLQDPGEQDIYDGVIDPFGDHMNGFIQWPSQPVDMTVRVGGMVEGLHCDDAPSQGDHTDTRVVSIGGTDSGGGGGGGGGGNGNGGNGGQPQQSQIPWGIVIVLMVLVAAYYYTR